MSINKKVFVSYNWDDSEIVDEIDNFFLSIGLPLIRDKKELQYKSSIKEFMKKVRSTDYVIMIVSDSFLKSPNCMFEVLELIKDNNYKDKILQIVLPTARIFSPIEKYQYIEYWNSEYESLKEKIKSIEPSDGDVLVKELKHISNIKSNIGSFLEFLTDENCLGFEEIKSNKYKQLTDIIGIKEVRSGKRPDILPADVFQFQIDDEKFLALVGILNGRPFEIFLGHEGDWFPYYDQINLDHQVLLILDQYNKESGRIDLQYTHKDDYKYTHEGVNRIFLDQDIFLFTRIIISLLQSNTDIDIVLNALDEMYTRGYENPYLWKEEMKKILGSYIGK